MKYCLITFFLLIASVTILAQENNCPVQEQAAISESRVWCADIAEEQACYGNSRLSAKLLADNLSFNYAGDKVPLDAVATISSSIEENQYGVAILHTVSYTMDSWKPNDVTLVMLGNLTIANTGNENINVPVITTQIVGSQGANVRTGTSTDYRIITPLFEDDTVKLTGRLADDSYYRLQLPSGESGWIAGGAIETDTSSLPVVDMDSSAPELLYAPYTSFSLETAMADAQCNESWESGLLVQSTKDKAVRLQINGSAFLLSGTIFVQSRANVDNRIFVIEGSVEYGDSLVEEGDWIRIPFDASGATIENYELSRMAYLPTEILPRYVYIGVDFSTIITPAPSQDRSPIADTLVTAPCILTTGRTGANLRGGPGNEFPIRGVLAFRETANPIGRTTGLDGANWWELAQNVWVSGAVVVTGGDCAAVPQSQRIPVLPPTPTPSD